MPERISNAILAELNDRQQQAVQHGDAPLLILAGAGTGKTMTLVHRVAALIERGIEPTRILLLTFSRRAAAEMLHRVSLLLARLHDAKDGDSPRISTDKVWGGTFHATGARLLRTYSGAIGLNPAFTIHDRTDSEDLMEVLRDEMELPKSAAAFPKKETLMAIYSLCVNSQMPLDKVVEQHYPEKEPCLEKMTELFRMYTQRKQQCDILDFDDLLLFWLGLMSDPDAGQRVRERFDAVLVDEYQDTNRLQSEILRKLRPDGRGMTAVGDDAQSIYSFRAATVRNILDFPEHFPGTVIVKLERNYRSVQPILDATNAIIAESREKYAKTLWTDRKDGEKPMLVACGDDSGQADFVARRIQSNHEAGTPLRQQAVLFRASHHSIMLEAELARLGIPFVKYGGLRFVEAAHVKDVLAFLRLAENYRDITAGTRVLRLLPGIGPRKAVQIMDILLASSGDLRAWRDFKPTSSACKVWPKFVKLMNSLSDPDGDSVAGQLRYVTDFYEPILKNTYDNSDARMRDLEQLQQIAERFPDRGRMIADLALDPPTSTGDIGRGPKPDQDHLVLSTVHSAKGLEWDAVFVISALDDSFPFIRAQGDLNQIEEERRLFYVALTRPRQSLCVTYPEMVYTANRWSPYASGNASRFITPPVAKFFRRATHRQRFDDFRSGGDFWQPPTSRPRGRD